MQHTLEPTTDVPCAAKAFQDKGVVEDVVATKWPCL
jgi:hypothetical protein